MLTYSVWRISDLSVASLSLFLSLSLSLYLYLYLSLSCLLSSDTYLPRGDLILLLALSILCLLLLPFFFVSLVSMLRPKDILLRMLYMALTNSDRQTLGVADNEIEPAALQPLKLRFEQRLVNSGSRH